jgi:hypothetical protein
VIWSGNLVNVIAGSIGEASAPLAKSAAGSAANNGAISNSRRLAEMSNMSSSLSFASTKFDAGRAKA